MLTHIVHHHYTCMIFRLFIEELYDFKENCIRIMDGSRFEGMYTTDNQRICFVHLGISLPDQYIRLWNIHNQGKCHITVTVMAQPK